MAVRPKLILGALVTLAMAGGFAIAQDAPAGIQTGPATIAPHWTRNPDFPTSIPEGTAYYVVVRGDTLWDIAAKFLENPYLWPQIWDQNKYIRDAHWIYPGDPLVLPKIALVAEQAGQAPPEGGPEGLEEGAGEGAQGAGAETAAQTLRPATQELLLQCAEYVVDRQEDESLYVLGSDRGSDKNALAERDLVYLNKGSNSGVKAGDLYTLHHVAYTLKHPVTGRKIGTKVQTTGWVKVILVQEDTACAVVEQSCWDIHAGDYLKPFEKVNVPMVLESTPEECCSTSSGKLTRHVVDFQHDSSIAGAGDFLTIDAGANDGVAPGSVFSVFRIMYPSVPTPRNVIGEATVVAVRDRTSTATLTYTRSEVMIGDQVELR
jgi:hypothetical protein